MALGFADDEELAVAATVRGKAPLIVGEDVLTEDMRVFLNGYLKTKSIRGTERTTKINHFYHGQWLANYPEYQAAWAQVLVATRMVKADVIEDRAVYGWLEPLHNKGVKTGHTIRRFSDTLAKGYMQAINPEWRDGGISVNIGPQSLAITHSVGGTTGGNTSIDVSDTSDKSHT